MQKRSAGLLLYRRAGHGIEFLLVHPGGPFWTRRDAGAWSIPKGGVDPGESDLEAACREFAEETGVPPPAGPMIPLGEAVQASRKVVVGFACEGDLDPDAIMSLPFEMEWPPRSGLIRSFPEVDRAAWFEPKEGRRRILPGQAIFIDRLLAALDG